MYNTRYKRASTRIAKRKKIQKYLGIFLIISATAAFLVGFVFLVRADFLQVKNFEVSGSKMIEADSLKNVANNFISGNKLLFIPKSNIIFLNKEKLKKTLLSQFTRLEKVEINKKFFSKDVELKITERSPDFVWCAKDGECFFMTKTGFIFEKILDEQVLSGLVAFEGLLDGSPIFKNFSTPDKMQNYSNFIDVLKRSEVEIYSINIESSDKAIAKTGVGDIFFSPVGKDLLLTAENTLLLINEIKNKNASAKINYIDARFDNKFYYKLYP